MTLLSLDSEGCGDKREKHALSIGKFSELPKTGRIGRTPRKKGRKPFISQDLFTLIAKHLIMEQVGVHGEMSVMATTVIMTAVTLSTIHERSFNQVSMGEGTADIFQGTCSHGPSNVRRYLVEG